MMYRGPRLGCCVALAGLLLACLTVLPVTAANGTARRLADYDMPGLQNKVRNLKTFEAWDVVKLIEFLAHLGGLNNVVIGQGVAGRSTKFKFDDVTVADALEVVLSVNNLAYEVKGGIITIMTDQEYQQLYGTSFYDQKRVEVVELRFADAGRVGQMLGAVKSGIGTIVTDPVTGTLVLIDTPEKIEEMRDIVTKADISTVSRVLPTVTRTFVLQYANVEDIESQVTAILTEQAGSVRADPRTKTLIVTDLPHKMEEVEEVVALFDRRPQQVFIEAKIVELRLNDDNRMGVNWDHVFQAVDPRFSLRTSSSPAVLGALGAARSPTFTMRYNTIVGGGDLGAVLEALSSAGETRILSNPHVAVLDGQEATIKVITDEPYAEAQLESGTTNVVGESIKFIEVGVTLSVVPRINEEKFINVDIKPEVSTKIGDYQAFRTVPIVRRSYAETSVMIKDGETIIIAGMIVNEKTDADSRVPVLGRVPLLGMLFRSKSEVMNKNELIVFLTPRIVSGEEPYQLLRDVRKQPKPMRRLGAVGKGKPLKPLR